MKIIFRFIIILSILLLSNCNGKKEKAIILDSTSLEEQMIEAYNKGVKALDEGDVLFAAKNFNAAENLYPQSIWAPRSILMASYSFYSQDYYGDAISELSRFLKNYPINENTAYAYFLLATCYYELIVDEKKDLSPLLKSKENFQIILDKYPNTDFALDARFKLLLINNILASKELYIGKYYLQKEKWIPAINRFKIIQENYSETDYVEEAIHRLVEVYYKIGLQEESKKYAITLGYNYQSSEWYKQSYKIFNKKYENPKEKIKKNKQNSIIKKFKKLF
ncbi:outer membrane protein assembly factor BamD [Candidatus Pelagibacter sp.]|nr:outer membrane protein assembly factor BamD [Candidatus Pelagibacter sp.]